MRRGVLAPFLAGIDRRLRINRHSNRGEHTQHGGSDAVYFDNKFVGAIPPGNIYIHGTKHYKGKQYRHRSLRGLLSLLRTKTSIAAHVLLEAERGLHTNQ